MVALRCIAMLAALPLQTQDPRDPASAVLHATAAVEGDSAQVVERRWQRAFAREPSDRIAALGLATLAHLTWRDSLAGHLYRNAMSSPVSMPRAGGPGIADSAVRRPASDRVAGYAALGLARMHASRYEWRMSGTATEAAIDAARQSGDALLLAESLVHRAYTWIQMTTPDSVVAALVDADAIIPPDALRVRALSRCVNAAALEARGDPRGAVHAARDGAKLAHRVGDLRTAGFCEYTLAVNHGNLFAVDSALASYERAHTSYRRARDRVGAATVLWFRGDFVRLFGQLGQARRDAEEAVREAEATQSWRIAGFAHLTLANVARLVGDERVAALESGEVARYAILQPDERLRSIAAGLMGSTALRQGDAAGARDGYERSVREAKRIGWVNGGMGAQLSLVWVALMNNDSAGAYSALDTARAWIARSRVRGHDDALSFREGTIALHFGDLAESERIFRARHQSTTSRGARRYIDAARLSEILVRTGRIAEAERELVTAAERLDLWRDSLGDRQLRLQAFQVSIDPVDPDIGIAFVIAALANGGRLASAFAVVERMRARALTDLLTRAVALDTTSGDRAVRAGPAVSLDSIRRALPDDRTAILEYVTGRGDPTTLFVITRRHVRAYVLASQDSFADRVARFNALIEAGDDPRRLGRELGSILIAPAIADLDPAVRRWIVVADGPLHRLPFDALALPDGRFVIERFAVTSAPSATVAARLLEPRDATPPSSIAVFADARFPRRANPSYDTDADHAVVGAGGLPRLRGSALEARVVARYSDNAVIRRRSDASEAWLKQAVLGGFGILHFATHALVGESALTNTALVLSPGDGEDGFVRPAELAQLPLTAELVVLSACRTAGGVVLRGEGVQGLVAPLIAAGARAVAVTWWPIGDAATVRMMDDFYRAMSEGHAAGDALRLAKLASLGRGAPAREWAAFTLVGDPLAHPLLRTTRTRASPLWAVLAAIAAIAAAIVYGVSMRRRRTGEAGVAPGVVARTHHR